MPRVKIADVSAPDLFASAEPKTCGNCGNCHKALATPGHYCERSYKTVLETDIACGPFWTPAKETK